ncbi:glycoside hydrolase family 26 protein [Sphingobacterium hungaricum]|uniref:Beta-mannosidase n=1 Tax=Sphingobacterium hungaricum TaxID=2082723 RepID=A0A928YQK4_9SPHI|nr:glycosyl hydrolase [Sphingobacterium hungaricum]MBE8712453.1 beta-mannosidase [Sphingobacterium hungaricum]
MKMYHALLFAALVACFSCEKSTSTEEEVTKPETEVALQLFDKSATLETKALYSQLWRIQSKGFMFGHHDGLIYGREWTNEPGRSDVKEIVDDYPAVFSVDFAELMDDRKNTSTLNAARKRTILEARKRGEVITAVCHLNNPLTGGDSWDNSSNDVAKQILLEGSATNLKFKSWLDNLAEFALSLKDDNGKAIPIIFRPFHEHTQQWSWWGSKCTTAEEFIQLWKFTQSYLKDTKSVHNFIYAISPQRDNNGTKQDLLFRWPGDDAVDFIGMDCYHGANTQAFQSNLRALQELSQEKLKPCGVTEIGIEGIQNGGAPYTTYWTNEILIPMIGKKVSMVVLWRNAYDPLKQGMHFYGPWKNHSSTDDFKVLFRSTVSLFSKDLPNMYVMADKVTVN